MPKNKKIEKYIILVYMQVQCLNFNEIKTNTYTFLPK